MTEQYDITFLPDEKKGNINKGATVFEAARALKMSIRSECGGKGTCGKCRVIPDVPGNLSPKTEGENKILSANDAQPSHRLACQAKIAGPVSITVPQNLLEKEEVDGKTGINKKFKLNRREKRKPKSGSGSSPNLGVAFDIGTTTIAAYLCNLNTGSIIASKAMANPQRQFGEDVIARIAAIREDEKALETQQVLAVSAMNALVKNCLDRTGYESKDIHDATVVGNTTMLHIFTRLNPKDIGVSPYLPVTRSSTTTNAQNAGLDFSSDPPVYVFPVISGFLGGDILSALLADRSYKRKETTLIVDIGTNGELMLTSSGGMWATSCATGPAFEGAQISSGMRAASGAISKVSIAPKTRERIIFKTIGDKKPKGICGSGIIDALAVMRKIGVTKENGTFDHGKAGVQVNAGGIGKRFEIPGSDILITLKDVRQVQLAKAALFVGIESLLNKARIKKVDRTILTGAFGAKFNWKNARDIGMLPSKILEGEVESARNLAGVGSVTALMDETARLEIETRSEQITFLDLACEPDFTTRFSEATKFP